MLTFRPTKTCICCHPGDESHTQEQGYSLIRHLGCLFSARQVSTDTDFVIQQSFILEYDVTFRENSFHISLFFS